MTAVYPVNRPGNFALVLDGRSHPDCDCILYTETYCDCYDRSKLLLSTARRIRKLGAAIFGLARDFSFC